MPTVKKILKSKAMQIVVAWLLSLYIRLVYATSSKRYDIQTAALPYIRGIDNAIFSFWHGRMMLLPAGCPPKRQMRVLISRHRDGVLISRVIAHFGQKTVVGSTSKGGQKAAGEILRALEKGDNIGITPDGPRGPAHVMSKGVVTLSRLTGKPILPVTFASSSAVRLNSWDHFMLALPFGRIVFCVGAPIVIPQTMITDDETMRLHVEQEMNTLMDRAESLLYG